MQFDEDNLDPAFALLARGMPERSRRFWETGLQRVLEAGHNRALGVPLGHYLLDRGRPAGVLLTFAAPPVRPAGAPASAGRTSDAAPVGVINLSSWYIEPECRWRAPLMLKQATRDPAFCYTSLTPVPSVERLLAACGFQPASRGTALVPTVHGKLLGSPFGRVADVARLPPAAEAALGPARIARLREHARLGCVALAFADGHDWQPLILKPRRMRGLPGLRLLHCESLAALDRRLGQVLRHLLGRGWLLLQMDVPSTGRGRGLVRPNGIIYRKGPAAPDVIDHANSELAYLDL